MNYLKNKILFFIACAVICLLKSCSSVTTWDQDVALPLANCTLRLEHFFQDSLFKKDQNANISLSVKQTLLDFKMNDLLKVPDSSIALTFTVPFAANLPPNTFISIVVPSQSAELGLNIPNSVEIRQINLRKGVLKFEFINTHSQPILFKYSINSATKNNNTFIISEIIPSNSNATKLVKSYVLDGYSLNCTGFLNNRVNTIVQSYTISTDESGVLATLNLGTGLFVKITFNGIEPEFISGYFGTLEEKIGSDVSKLEAFNQLKPNLLKLTQATANIFIENNFGADFKFNLDKIESINTTKSNSITLNSSSSFNNINLNRAKLLSPNSNMIIASTKSISMDKSNSNIISFIENLPDKIAYAGNYQLNPLGNVSFANDFAVINKGLKVLLDLNIPLNLTIDKFQLVNTSNISYSSLLDNVNYGELILNAVNTFPLNFKLQGYLLDSSGNTLDSLITQNINNYIPSALYDGNNILLQVSEKKITINFNKQKLMHLKNSVKIKYNLILESNNASIPIKLTASNILFINAVMNANYTNLRFN